jgi:pimeloyl-ACP methyl ester carboxylesterase
MQQRLRAIAHQTLADIKDAGHMVHQDNPEALAETVTEFLGRD